ncbi:MAG: hypothetical protein ACOY82_14385 [Pseudomonadota bacterium]
MKKRLCGAVVAASLLLPLGDLGATNVELFGARYAPGRPTADDAFLDAVEDRSWAERAIAHDLDLFRRIPGLRYRVGGSTDGRECSDRECDALALRRAVLFQAALVEAGADAGAFCPPNAVATPWPTSYTPSPSDLVIGRQATLEPVFDDCD